MSDATRCACCPNMRLPGKLLCATCKAHAAELEHVRLSGLERQPYPAGPGFVVHGRRAGGKALALASLGLAIACGGGGPKVPCDAHDHAAQFNLTVELNTCRSRIDACTTVACVDAVEADCNRAAEQRCKELGK